MLLIVKILSFLFFFTCYASHGQVEEKERGFTGFQEYDDSFITPDLRGKHVVSFGPVMGFHSAYYRIPETDPAGGDIQSDIDPNGGIHLGYNYTVLEKRNLKLSKKNKTRDEVKVSGGFHFHLLLRGEWLASINFYKPLVGRKGRLLSWSFFSSYSLGIHNLPADLELLRPRYINANLEIFRLRFGRLPFYVQGGLNYDITNNFLDKEKMYAGLFFGLRYDFFKNKKRR